VTESEGGGKPELGALGARKQDHVRICLTEESQFRTLRAGFDALYFEHQALPEIALSEVDLNTKFLGKTLSAPILVSSMTGGPEMGATINRHLAQGVEAAGLALGVGSQRIAIEHPEASRSFEVRLYAPNALLFANLGAVQLNCGYGLEEAERAVEMIGADALFLHLNPLQEAIQEGGDTDFRGLTERIGALAKVLPFPVLVKECGAGIGPDAMEALVARGVAAVDVSGAGGTSWAQVEGLRAESEIHRALGETFRDWGVPTTVLITAGRRRCPDATIIASGGIRSGLDAAKALALGADLVSIAKPVLAAALESGEAVEKVLSRFKRELQVALFCVGARNPAELRDKAILRDR
jgi:isopentenyl-diphosphate delta-isomerase